MSIISCIKMEDRSSSRAVAPVDVLQSVLAALNQRNISRAVDHFADDFAFKDYGLNLEFTDKGRLTQFFQKSFEVFPDALVELVSTLQCGDYAIAEWKLTATEPESLGSISYRLPIVLRGATVAQIGNGRAVRWSDYYDQLTSRRVRLGAFFEEWIEY